MFCVSAGPSFAIEGKAINDRPTVLFAIHDEHDRIKREAEENTTAQSTTTKTPVSDSEVPRNFSFVYEDYEELSSTHKPTPMTYPPNVTITNVSGYCVSAGLAFLKYYKFFIQ